MFTPVNLNTMTARGLKYISTNNDEERTRLIDTSDEINSFVSTLKLNSANVIKHGGSLTLAFSA